MARTMDTSGRGRAAPYTIPDSTDTKPKKASPSKGIYDKKIILALVLAQVKPNWPNISSAMDNKKESQVFDVWRKSIHPALISGKVWSSVGSTSGSWTHEEKVKLVGLVLASSKIEWSKIADSFPGHTKSQLYDVWRKVIFPKLKRGEPVE